MVAPRHWAIAARLFARSRTVQAQDTGRMTRRTVLGGRAAGAIASTIGVHETAAAAPRTTTVVDPVARKRILAVVKSRSAEWGKPTAVEHVSGSVPMFVVHHDKNKFSLIPESDQTLVLGLVVDVVARKLAYYLPGSSTVSATVIAKNGQTQVIPGVSPSVAARGVQPQSVRGKLKCFALCLGEEAIDLACFNACVTGAAFPCTLCAGQKGIVCAIKARRC